MYKHILIPTDGSERSERAVRAGIALARTTHAKVTLLTVSAPYRVAASHPLSVSASPAAYASDRRAAATALLSAGQEIASKAGVEATARHIFSKHPFEAIIDTAAQESCDLIFMASRGKMGGIAGLLIGSETQKVLTHTTTPVLVCH